MASRPPISRVLITGGGTGGHVYPALAVAAELDSAARTAGATHPTTTPNRDERNASVLAYWIGSTNGMERTLVERTDVTYYGIDTGQLRGVGAWRAVVNSSKMLHGLWQARALVRELRPAVCLATGGYVCVPVVWACRLLGVPVLIYLPDMTPGAAIRFLSRFAARVAVTLPNAAQHFGGEYPAGKAVVTGYPVRAALRAAAADRAAARRQLAQALNRPLDNGELPLVLILGGSQGARSINRAIWNVLMALLPHAHLLHIIGTRDWDTYQPVWQEHLSSLPAELAERYHPVAYLHEEMPLALAAADVSVARAGASVLGEFTVARLPSILVPLPFAGVNQTQNARTLADHGAALIVADDALQSDLAPALLTLLHNRKRRRDMEDALARLARPDAAQAIATELHKLAGSA